MTPRCLYDNFAELTDAGILVNLKDYIYMLFTRRKCGMTCVNSEFPIIAVVLGLLTALGSLPCWAQGDLLFSNYGNGANAPDYLCDSITRLSGTEYMAELVTGPTATNLTSFATIPFRSGDLSGYFNGGVVTVNQACYICVQINIWNTNAGPNFEAAKASGRINVLDRQSCVTAFRPPR